MPCRRHAVRVWQRPMLRCGEGVGGSNIHRRQSIVCHEQLSTIVWAVTPEELVRSAEPPHSSSPGVSDVGQESRQHFRDQTSLTEVRQISLRAPVFVPRLDPVDGQEGMLEVTGFRRVWQSFRRLARAAVRLALALDPATVRHDHISLLFPARQPWRSTSTTTAGGRSVL